MKISFSTQLMDNFLEAGQEIISKDHKFEVAQTQEGHSLFFSLGTDGIFYLTRETLGSRTGWEKINLTDSLKAALGHADLKVKTFAVRQNDHSHRISIAVAIVVNGEEQLVISAKQENHDESFGKNYGWQLIAYDSDIENKLAIADIFLSYSDDEEIFVVDTYRNPNKQNPLVYRFCIYPQDSQKWQPRDLPIDGEACKHVTNIVGRVKGKEVDGIYTLVHVNDKGSLIYIPLQGRNKAMDFLLDDAAMNLQDMAIVSNEDGTGSELFVVAQNDDLTNAGLYYFPAEGQHRKSTRAAIKLQADPIYRNVISLHAGRSKEQVVLWGLNKQQEVFYTSCHKDHLKDPESWSVPVALVTEVHQVAPYLNHTNEGNTFFVHRGVDELQKFERDTETSIWKSSAIHIPPLDEKNRTLEIKSFTTKVILKDDDERVIPDQEVKLSAPTRTAFYINNEYHVLDNSSTTIIKTDAWGAITLIEAVDGINGASIYAQVGDGKKERLDTSDLAVEKVEKLDSVDALNNAKPVDHNGKEAKDSIFKGADPDQLETTAKLIGLMKAVRQKQGNNNANETEVLFASLPEKPIVLSLNGGGSDAPLLQWGFKDFVTSVGDGLRYISQKIKEGVKAAIKISKNIVDGIVNFAVTIGGKIVKFVVKTVKQMAKALETVLKAIASGLKKLWDFLKFLFNWEDIKLAKEVICKLSEHGFQILVGLVEAGKLKMDDAITVLKAQLEHLKSNKDSILGDNDTIEANTKEHSKDKHGSMDHMNSSEGSLLAHHIKHNADNAKDVDSNLKGQLSNLLSTSASGDEPSLSSLWDYLKNLFEDSAPEFEKIWKGLKDLIEKMVKGTIDRVTAMNDLIEIAEGILGLMNLALDAIFDLAIAILNLFWELVTARIHIPVVSDFLTRYVGIDEFSVLDIAGYVIAVPAVLIYKAIFKKAPFEKDDPILKELNDFSIPENLGAVRSKYASPMLQEKKLSFGYLEKDLPDVEGALHYYFHKWSVCWSTKTRMIIYGFSKICHGYAQAFLTVKLANFTASTEEGKSVKRVGKFWTVLTAVDFCISIPAGLFFKIHYDVKWFDKWLDWSFWILTVGAKGTSFVLEVVLSQGNKLMNKGVPVEDIQEDNFQLLRISKIIRGISGAVLDIQSYVKIFSTVIQFRSAEGDENEAVLLGASMANALNDYFSATVDLASCYFVLSKDPDAVPIIAVSNVSVGVVNIIEGGLVLSKLENLIPPSNRLKLIQP